MHKRCQAIFIEFFYAYQPMHLPFSPSHVFGVSPHMFHIFLFSFMSYILFRLCPISRLSINFQFQPLLFCTTLVLTASILTFTTAIIMQPNHQLDTALSVSRPHLPQLNKRTTINTCSIFYSMSMETMQARESLSTVEQMSQ